MNNSRRNGIILLEVLIALVVMGIGCMAMMQALSFLVRQDTTVHLRSQAYLLAENIFHRRIAGDLSEPEGEEILGGYAFSWRIDSQNEDPSLAVVAVSLLWGRQGGIQQLNTIRYTIAPPAR